MTAPRGRSEPAGSRPPKIVITGTGRAGTTLLVQLLDQLGLDTGLEGGRLTPYMPSVRAGLECRVDDPEAPTVVKDMTLGFRMRAVLERGDVRIERVLLPTRRLEIATASRIRAAGYGRLPFRRGALTGTMHATGQRKVLEGMRAEILGALADFDIPCTEIEFPRFATDAEYTREVLGFLAPAATVEDIQAALDRVVRRELIHEAPLSPGERWRTRATTVWMALVRLPIARVRRKLDPEGSEARLRASVAAAQRRQAATVAERDHAGTDVTEQATGSDVDGPAAPP
jgi:hypothetical protein